MDKTKEKKEKVDTGYRNLIKMFPFYKKFWKLMLAIIIFAALSAGLATLRPIYNGKLIALFTNVLREDLDITKILIYACISLGIVFGLQILYYFWTQCAVKLQAKVKYDLKHDMIEKVVEITPKTFDSVNSGTFISRLNKDASELSDIFGRVIDFICDIISNFAFLLYVFFISWQMGLFLTIFMVIIFIIEKYRLNFRFAYRKEWKAKDEYVVGSYSEIVRGVRDIKSLNIKDNAIEMSNGYLNEEIQVELRGSTINNMWNRGRRVAQGLLDFAFILLSVFLIMKGWFTVEGFLIVLMYKGNILNFVNYVVNVQEILKEGELSALRVFEVVEGKVFEKEEFGDLSVDSIKGSITFKDVDFKYGGEKLLFENLNFNVKPNSVVALVGKSGQGKTTILNLINKMYNIEQKEDSGIFIDDYNIYDLTKESLRQNISIVPQSPYIFNISIRDNLKLVKKDATEEEMIEVCKKAQIYDFIKEKEEGFDSIVGENGIVLSGGQKQRLAIARALLKNSKIILLDEATSALDNESQAKIKEVIHNLKSEHTIVVVAHRLSTVVDADKIMFLENNKIIAEGTHKELMKKVPAYKELYAQEE